MTKITRVPMSKDGALLSDLDAPSPDAKHSFEMQRGTIARGPDGKVIDLVTIRQTTMPALAEDKAAVGSAYEFEPSKAAFSKPVVVALGYDVDQVPKQIRSIGLSYYTSESGWVDLKAEGGVAGAGSVAAPVEHFTIFALVATRTPPSYNLSNLVIVPSTTKIWDWLPILVRTGESADISADVRNDGGLKGDYAGVLRLNGKEVARQTIALAAGQAGTLHFKTTGIELGNYVVETAGPGDLLLRGELASTLWIDWWLVLILLIVLCLVIWFLYRTLVRRI